MRLQTRSILAPRHRSRRAAVGLGIALTLGVIAPSESRGSASSRQVRQSEHEIELLQNLYSRVVGSKEVTVEVLPLPGGFYAVILNGTVKTDGAKTRLEADAHSINRDPKVTILSKLTVKPPADPKEVTDLWNLTYIRSHVTVTGEVAPVAGGGTKDNVDALVDALNEIYGTPAAKEDPAKPAVQRAGSGRLLLRGTKETVIAIKRFLALADAPWPQVQMNLWAVQVSGQAKDVTANVNEIGRRIRRTRDRMGDVQRHLAQSTRGDDQFREELARKFAKPGIDLNFEGPLSLNESLILLTLHPHRQDRIRELQEFVIKQFSDHVEEDLADDCPEAREISGYSWGESQKHCKEERRQKITKLRPFHRLQEVLAAESYMQDRAAFDEFGKALICFKEDDVDQPHHPDAPRWLSRTGATIDRVLKSVMDAFAADMEETYLTPLLDDLQRNDIPRRSSGVALVGRTRIVVTSGLEAGLAPELASYVETTRPKPFGKDLLDLAFPAGKSGDTGTLTGANRVLANVPEAQAALLAAVLLSETEPTFAKVAPGIAINVRPTVLPDGGSARLTIDARFGVNSTPLSTAARTDVWAQAPPDGITSHNVKTDAVVSAFDLFDLSSFSVTTSHPQTPFYIPILGRLPILGPAFQIPRHNKEAHFESIVLVNTVILPRSLELHRFYGRDATEPAKAKTERAEPEDSRCIEMEKPAAKSGS